MKNNEKINSIEYLNQKNIQYKSLNGEIQIQCPFNTDCISQKHAGHCYMNEDTGQYHCKTCNEKGNLLTLMQHFGDSEQYNLIKPKNDKPNDTTAVEKNTTLTKEEVLNYHKNLKPEIISWLVDTRGIKKDVIDEAMIGYGHFYKKTWITFPIETDNGYFLKLRKDPFDDKNEIKHSVYPKGNGVALYGKKNFTGNDDYIVICEGELDQLVLESNGIVSITSTGGAGTFKDEWYESFEEMKEVYVCLDKDECGINGANAILEKLSNKYDDIELFNIALPEETGEKGDVGDYFVKLKKSVDEFMALKQPYAQFKKNNRIIKLKPPKREISPEEWQRTILGNFPDFLFPAEIGLATLSQILINDVTNPFAVILLDVPSSGKTITINFFDGIEGLVYASDKFSAASFVSHAANVKQEKLKKIDLLPRLRYKMFLIRDFASIFSQREDDLRTSLGILTRVLDGEGFESDSGIHGNRGYHGEYLFMILGASTPIPPRIWKIMGNLGSRLFFLNLNSPDKDEDELATQLTAKSYKIKEKACKKATHNRLRTLWNKYPNGVDWDSSKDDIELLKIISRCAKLLAKLRGVINVWREKGFGGDEYSYTKPIIEKPDRLNQLLYNLARGHALAFGRTNLTKPDIRAVIKLVFDSADIIRTQVFKKLVENGGSLSTLEIEKALNCSKPTAIKEMQSLKILEICDMEVDNDELTIGRPPKKITIRHELLWFLSNECKDILNN